MRKISLPTPVFESFAKMTGCKWTGISHYEKPPKTGRLTICLHQMRQRRCINNCTQIPMNLNVYRNWITTMLILCLCELNPSIAKMLWSKTNGIFQPTCRV